MSAKDFYHEQAKNALINDGWTITNDPLMLRWGRTDLFVDLGAKRLLAAQKEEEEIAVEIKTFLARSNVTSLHNAIGQYLVYRDVLAEIEPQRTIYLAIPQAAMEEVFEEPLGQLMIKNNRAKLIVFDPEKEVITQWVK